jgi:hypothetical protein
MGRATRKIETREKCRIEPFVREPSLVRIPTLIENRIAGLMQP